MEAPNDKFLGGLTPPKPVDTRTHATVSHASTKDRVTIIINESDKPEDLNEVFVSVNGRAYQIQRGVPAAVPPEVVHALDNAVIDKAIQQYENGMPAGIILRPTRRYPYQFQSPEDSLVYRAWIQRSIDFRNSQIAADEVPEE